MQETNSNISSPPIITPEISAVPNPVTITSPQKSNAFTFLKAIVLVESVALTIMGFLIFSLINSKNSPTLSTIPTDVPSTQIPVISKSTSNILLFTKDGEIWKKENDIEQVLTETSKTITRYDVSPNQEMFATIEGERINVNSATTVRPNKVFLYDSKNKSKKEILNYPFVQNPNEEYSYQIRDVNFTPDSKYLSITTSESLYLYDLSKQTIEKVFEKKLDKNILAGGIFSYYDPQISPDGQKAILVRGYYENADFGVYYLGTDKIVEIAGDRAPGMDSSNFWLDNDNILSVIVDDSVNNTTFSRLNLSTNQTTILNSIPYNLSSYSMHFDIKSKTLYAVAYENSTKLFNIIKWNSISNTLTVIEKETTNLKLGVGIFYSDIQNTLYYDARENDVNKIRSAVLKDANNPIITNVIENANILRLINNQSD